MEIFLNALILFKQLRKYPTIITLCLLKEFQMKKHLIKWGAWPLEKTVHLENHQHCFFFKGKSYEC